MRQGKPGVDWGEWAMNAIAAALHSMVMTALVVVLRPDWYGAIGIDWVHLFQVFGIIFTLYLFIAQPLFLLYSKNYEPSLFRHTVLGGILGSAISIVFILANSLGYSIEGSQIWDNVPWIFVFSFLGVWFSWVMLHIT